MRILYLTHYFHPEGNAPATRVYQLARRWATEGHDVHVVTAIPNVPTGVPYPGYQNKWRQVETIDGIRVTRVWTYLAANAGRFRRTVCYLSFMLTATLAGLRTRRPDRVIATSPQFFCGLAGRLVAALRRLPFILEVRDLWPESIVAVGAMRRSPAVRTLEWLERKLYSGAVCIVTVGDGYVGKLAERGVDAGKIRVVPNGVDLSMFGEGVDGVDFRREFGLEDRFVCAFIGTIGMASGLDVVLRAAEVLKRRADDTIRFLLVGDGAERQTLETDAAARGLREIVFTGRLPKERMPEAVAAADVCLVHLRRTDLFTSVMPSKIFEAAAMRRPIVLGVEGFAAEWLNQADAGIAITPEDENELLSALQRLAADPESRVRFGDNARSFVEQHHDYELLAARYLGILSQLPDGHKTR